VIGAPTAGAANNNSTRIATSPRFRIWASYPPLDAEEAGWDYFNGCRFEVGAGGTLLLYDEQGVAFAWAAGKWEFVERLEAGL
jgi:hypothetical protein